MSLIIRFTNSTVSMFNTESFLVMGTPGGELGSIISLCHRTLGILGFVVYAMCLNIQLSVAIQVRIEAMFLTY